VLWRLQRLVAAPAAIAVKQKEKRPQLACGRESGTAIREEGITF
jgi:hypothetical protein